MYIATLDMLAMLGFDKRVGQHLDSLGARSGRHAGRFNHEISALVFRYKQKRIWIDNLMCVRDAKVLSPPALSEVGGRY